jgi:PAS domain S-box-containing protein
MNQSVPLEAQNLTLTNSLFDRILERSLNEIYIFDAATLRFIQVNEGARRNLGYTLRELRAMTPLDVKPEYTQESFQALINPLRSGRRQKIQFQTVHRRKDGSEYPVEVHLQHMPYDSTTVFVAIILDITRRRRADEQARLIQATAEGIYGVDQAGNCTFCNAAMLRLLGYRDEQAVLGKNTHQLFHHSHADGTPHAAGDCRIRQVLSNNQPCHVDDEVFWRADGSSLAVEYWAYPIVQDGRVTGCVVSFIDISERRAALELLRRAKETAETASAMKSRFLAAASHDLRQPLQAARVYLSVLTRTLEQNNQHDIAQRMTQSLEVMGELLTGDTTASEIEAASLDNCTILHKPVDLDRLIALIERRQFD